MAKREKPILTAPEPGTPLTEAIQHIMVEFQRAVDYIEAMVIIVESLAEVGK